jgi:hypothetical protein
MAFITIKGKEYEAKVNFKFRSTADKKYTKETKDGEVDGFTNLYSNLLEENVGYLAAFWDCALSHLKERPSIEQIENALVEAAGDEQDYEPLIKEAFEALDDAGFFRGQVKKFWKNTEIMKDFAENDKEKKVIETEIKTMKENRKKLTGKEK